jgi:dephospho-CoA kinase
MIIGITGGTGSGKTTLLKLMEQLGVLVLDCDAIYHELLTTSPALLTAIQNRFPGTVENGLLQRKKLGEIVFSDKNDLLDLNKITHSAISAEILRRLESCPAHAAIDAVALFESGMDKLCDITVAVTAPADVRVKRLMERDCISAEYAQKRIDAQPSADWFRGKSTYTLENNGTEADFQTKCLAFLQELGIMKA